LDGDVASSRANDPADLVAQLGPVVFLTAIVAV
jgi:hypothetical protein